MRTPAKSQSSLSRRRAAPSLALTLALFAVTQADAASQQVASLKLQKILGGKQACTVGNNSVQFVSEDELLILAGPTSDCYRSVNDLELVVVSTGGQVIARKPWPSTFPSVVLSSKRIVIADSNNILVLDDHLRTTNTVPLPSEAARSSVSLSKEEPDTLLVRSARGEIYQYRGTPLQRVNPPTSTKRGNVSVIYSSEDGGTVAYNANTRQLIETAPNGTSRVLVDLTWVIGCDKFCQEYDAGTAWSVASQGKKRVLVVSNGSRFPITDAAGLFPYFHLAVIDLKNGAEVYRKQYITKTSKRAAQISPDGDLIALSDGDYIEIDRLG
jgi:hypothetical protein